MSFEVFLLLLFLIPAVMGVTWAFVDNRRRTGSFRGRTTEPDTPVDPEAPPKQS